MEIYRERGGGERRRERGGEGDVDETIGTRHTINDVV